MKTRFTCIAIKQLTVRKRTWGTTSSPVSMRTNCKTIEDRPTNIFIPPMIAKWRTTLLTRSKRGDLEEASNQQANARLIPLHCRVKVMQAPLNLIKLWMKPAARLVLSVRKRTPRSKGYIIHLSTKPILAMCMTRSRIPQLRRRSNNNAISSKGDSLKNANVERNVLSIMIKLKKEILIKALLSVHLFKIHLDLVTSNN